MSYRIRNWSEYNAGLKQRGSLTFWIEESVLASWIVPNLSGKPGTSILYSDLAILTWRKLRLGIDEATGEILAVSVTTNDISDGQDQVEGKLTQFQGMEPMTNGNATMRFGSVKPRQPFHRVEAQRSGSMATVTESVTTGMRICGAFAKSGGKPGNRKVAIIVGLWQRRRCSDLRRSLAGV
jgi:Transposase DDE domain